MLRLISLQEKRPWRASGDSRDSLQPASLLLWMVTTCSFDNLLIFTFLFAYRLYKQSATWQSQTRLLWLCYVKLPGCWWGLSIAAWSWYQSSHLTLSQKENISALTIPFIALSYLPILTWQALTNVGLQCKENQALSIFRCIIVSVPLPSATMDFNTPSHD